MQNVKTPDEVRLELYQQGKTITQWADENGFHRVKVSQVLNGANKGLRGQGLEIAIKLGLKAKGEL